MTGCRWTVLGKTREFAKGSAAPWQKVWDREWARELCFSHFPESERGSQETLPSQPEFGGTGLRPFIVDQLSSPGSSQLFFQAELCRYWRGKSLQNRDKHRDKHRARALLLLRVCEWRQSESRWSRWCLRRNPEHLSGQSQPVSLENSFSFSTQTFLFRNLGFVEAKMLIAIIPMHSYRRYWFLTFSAKINLPYVDV